VIEVRTTKLITCDNSDQNTNYDLTGVSAKFKRHGQIYIFELEREREKIPASTALSLSLRTR
jgi:hypothetical protein